MFVSKRQQENDRTNEVIGALEQALRSFLEIGSNSDTLHVRGLTVSENKQGDGYLSILRLTLREGANPDDLHYGIEPGCYVVYGNGEDIIGAIANLEAQLQLQQATLSPDKYAK